MKIALLGYGKMGREIEKAALERGHEIVLIIDETNTGDMTLKNLKMADTAIDFSIPGTAFDNIMKCFDADIPVVCGTTGWLGRFDLVTERCNKENKSFFYASNFSLGVNILFAVNKHLARIMDRFADYNVEIKEIHHIHKVDAPSGTAISLANDLISKIHRKTKWELARSTASDAIKIEAVREDEIPGIHVVTFDSAIDTLKISHEAKSRKGLALGALMAAEFIRDKRGCFSMSDLLQLD